MKRIISVFLCFIIAFSLVSCAKGTSSEGGDGKTIVGTWKYSHNEEFRDFITDAITDPGVFVDMYYIFNADGTGMTYLSTDPDDPMEFEYRFDGEKITIIAKNGTFDTPAKLKGDILSVFDGEKYQDFKRQ